MIANFPQGKFPEARLDVFSKLVNADLTERRKSDPNATYEASVRDLAKRFPDLWERHISQVGHD